MKKSRLFGIVCTCIITATSSHNAQASLIGDTISATGSTLGPASATIDDSVEFTGVFGFLNFDFGASTLTLSSTGASWGAFGDYVFSDFDSTITGLSLASNSGFSGDFLNRISFTVNSITFDMTQGDATGSPAILVYNIETSAVPLPAAVWLFSSGLLGLIGISRRKKVT